MQSWVPLSGTGVGEQASALRLGLAQIGGRGAVVAAQDRSGEPDVVLGPGSLRSLQRAALLAQDWQLPLITVVDTTGAELSKEAEEGALAGEIARSLATLMRLRTPTVSVLLGSGTGGGALAMMPADRVIAAGNAWVTPLPPEGAAVIRHGDPGYADQMAAQQQITAAHLAAVGAVDVVVSEHGDWLGTLAQTITNELAALPTHNSPATPTESDLVTARRARWRSVAVPTS